MSQSLTSSHFPYVPLHLEMGHRDADVEALLDTGFHGDVALPAGLTTDGEPADGYLPWTLADGSEVSAPAYDARVQIGELPPLPAVVIVLGDEPLVGRGVSDRFRIILEHGQRLIVEP